MALMATCRKCGKTLESNFIGIGEGGSIQNLHITGTHVSRCPECGGDAVVHPGHYTAPDGIIHALTAPGMTREKVQKFKEIAEAVEAGEKDAHTAYQEVIEIDDRLADAWNWTNDNAGALGVLLAILTILLAHYYWKQSGASAEEDRRVAERQSKALEKIGEELEKQRIDGATPVGQLRPTQEMLTQPLKQIATSSTPNRHERRKAAAIERRKNSGSK